MTSGSLVTLGGDDLGADVAVWVADEPHHGATNVGIVADDDGLTMVDTLITPRCSAEVAAALEGRDRPIRRVVYTSSHIEFVGGSPTFWMAARYGRALTSALLDQPPNVDALCRLHPDHADELVEPATRPVSHVTDAAAWLTPRVCAVPTAGQQAENLVVLVPAADVLFAGAMCCFGVTPNAFDGDPAAWADALGELGDLAGTVVPGIGPVGDADAVLALQAYLWACVEAEGDPAGIPSGPWDRWTDRHLDEVNVERAARLAAGDDGVPRSMLRLLGLVDG